MIWLYRALTSVVYALTYPYGVSKASNGSTLWQGRLGLIAPKNSTDIWMHAASVGESKVLRHLVTYLLSFEPGIRLHITVMTRAGFDAVARDLGGKECRNVTVSFFPFDAGASIGKTLSILKPELMVFAETEIWPNLIMQCARQRIPMVLVNGRMSEGSFGRYKLIRRSLEQLLSKYERFFFKTKTDQQRYLHFGVSHEKSVVTGDMKFDAPLLPETGEQVQQIRAELGVTKDQFLFVAGSTRPGEEDIILRTYLNLKVEHQQLRLVLAPRHLDRLDEAKNILNANSVPYSVYGDTSNSESVILIDRMGILNDLYLAADLAFVGGTLVDIGGHNILEPVWAGTPVLFGPYLSNVQEAAQYIDEHDFGCRVASQKELENLLNSVMSGKRSFNRKTATDMEHSATAVVGKYILELLGHG